MHINSRRRLRTPILAVALLAPLAPANAQTFGLGQPLPLSNIHDLVPLDVDFDGDLDVIGVRDGDRFVYVLENANGTLGAPVSVGQFSPYSWGACSGLGPSFSLEAGDLNGDGNRDLVVASYGYSGGCRAGLTVLLSTGPFSFEPRVWSSSDYRLNMEVLDVDGDGSLDVFGGTSSVVKIGYGDGNGNLAQEAQISVGGTATGISASDMDGDGIPDLVSCTTTDRVFWNPGDGPRSYASPVLISTAIDDPEALLIHDNDDDGLLDILVSDAAGNIHQIRNLGGGVFSTPTIIAIGVRCTSMQMLDINRDGQLQLVCVRADADQMEVIPRFGPGIFGPPSSTPLGSIRGRRTIRYFDLDGDQDRDLVYPSGWAENVEDLGSEYCPGAPNETGVPGRIELTGSRAIMDNALRVRAVDLPTFTFGLFVVSDTPGSIVPPGSLGTLCVGGAIGRLLDPNGQPFFTGVFGQMTAIVDLGNVPTSFGSTQVLAGETLHFQAWHRDASAFNFSGASEVTFF